jgi:hypothetical protein
MGYAYARPISSSVPAGAATVVIPLNRYAARSHIQVAITGANTFSIDSTLDTVLWDQSVIDGAANLQPRGDDVADPSTAAWVEEQASGSASVTLKLNSPVAAIRIVKSVGAGTAEVRVQQT